MSEEQHTVDVAGSRIALTEFLGPGGRTCVLLHGWGSSGAALRPIALHLAKRAGRVLVFDLPGFGRSPAPPGVWGTPEYSAAVLGVLDRLGVTSALWLGHSFGGKVSLFSAAEAPARVERLILIASAGVPRRKTLGVRLRVRGYKAVRFALRHLGAWGRATAERMAERAGSEDYRRAGALRPILVRLVQEDLRPRIATIRCPALLLQGEADTTVTLAHAQELAGLLQQSQLVTFPGVGHFPFVDRLPQVLTQIDRFTAEPQGDAP